LTGTEKEPSSQGITVGHDSRSTPVTTVVWIHELGSKVIEANVWERLHPSDTGGFGALDMRCSSSTGVLNYPLEATEVEH